MGFLGLTPTKFPRTKFLWEWISTLFLQLNRHILINTYLPIIYLLCQCIPSQLLLLNCDSQWQNLTSCWPIKIATNCNTVHKFPVLTALLSSSILQEFSIKPFSITNLYNNNMGTLKISGWRTLQVGKFDD